MFSFFGCSFDNKTGIWKSESDPSAENINEVIFKDFKKISSSRILFNEIVELEKNFVFQVNKPITVRSWQDIFYNNNNNLINFKYYNQNKIKSKSKKLTKYPTNKYILFEKNNLISSDVKGNIIIYSLSNKSITVKFNFYKKKYKDKKKKINFIVENNVIYASDNLGYLYAYNYEKDKIIWAKNYKIPFRSNIKLLKDKIITSNQNNNLLIFEKNTGKIIKTIPSEDTIVNNSFVNNIVLSDEEIFFLNTYGSLYSIDINTYNINWFLNFNKSTDRNLNNLFFGSHLVLNNNNILLSSNENFYLIDAKNGSVIYRKNFSSIFKPIVNNKYFFLITKNNLLVSVKLNSGQILYSYNIPQKVADFINTKRKTLEFKNLMFVNGNIYVFLKNSHVIKFNINGEIIDIIKLPTNLKSEPIFVNNLLLYLNKKNQLLTIN